jgi:hypothetical protein
MIICLLLADRSAGSAGALVLTNGNLIDGIGDEPRRGVTILISRRSNRVGGQHGKGRDSTE